MVFIIHGKEEKISIEINYSLPILEAKLGYLYLIHCMGHQGHWFFHLVMNVIFSKNGMVTTLSCRDKLFLFLKDANIFLKYFDISHENVYMLYIFHLIDS